MKNRIRNFLDRNYLLVDALMSVIGVLVLVVLPAAIAFVFLAENVELNRQQLAVMQRLVDTECQPEPIDCQPEPIDCQPEPIDCQPERLHEMTMPIDPQYIIPEPEKVGM